MRDSKEIYQLIAETFSLIVNEEEEATTSAMGRILDWGNKGRSDEIRAEVKAERDKERKQREDEEAKQREDEEAEGKWYPEHGSIKSSRRETRASNAERQNKPNGETPIVGRTSISPGQMAAMNDEDRGAAFAAMSDEERREYIEAYKAVEIAKEKRRNREAEFTRDLNTNTIYGDPTKPAISPKRAEEILAASDARLAAGPTDEDRILARYNRDRKKQQGREEEKSDPIVRMIRQKARDKRRTQGAVDDLIQSSGPKHADGRSVSIDTDISDADFESQNRANTSGIGFDTQGNVVHHRDSFDSTGPGTSATGQEEVDPETLPGVYGRGTWDTVGTRLDDEGRRTTQDSPNIEYIRSLGLGQHHGPTRDSSGVFNAPSRKDITPLEMSQQRGLSDFSGEGDRPGGMWVPPETLHSPLTNRNVITGDQHFGVNNPNLAYLNPEYGVNNNNDFLNPNQNVDTEYYKNEAKKRIERDKEVRRQAQQDLNTQQTIDRARNAVSMFASTI
jgi:hypothetical protein